MNKTFIANLENYSIYLISTPTLSFYLNVPKTKTEVDITLDINFNKIDNINEVINHYEKIDNYNVVLLLPTIKLKEEEREFKNQSNLISLVINMGYKLLTHNNIEVKRNINLIKHQNYKGQFINFFLLKFGSRVKYTSLEDLVHEEVPYNKLDAASFSFVIGKPELDLTIKEEEMKNIIQKEDEVKEVPIPKRKTSYATSGYVSYYLLGFLTAVVTLLMLTFLINR